MKIQLLMVADMIKTSLKDKMAIKEVTNVRTIADAMQQSEIYKGMLTEDVENILHISSYISHSWKIFFSTTENKNLFKNVYDPL